MFKIKTIKNKTVLVIQAGKKNSSILKLKDKGTELTSFAVESRYPEFEEPSLFDTENVLKIAEEFRSYIIKKIKDKNWS